MKKLFSIILAISVININSTRADELTALYVSLRTKVLSVKDYIADVKMKIDVNYMHIPQLKGKLYFKMPDKMRLERHGGISLLPKKNINLTLSNLIPSGTVTVIDAGIGVIAGKKVRIIKVIPEDDMNNIVLTKIWVNEEDLLALRTETTTRSDGTLIMDLEFGNYKKYALPDKVTIHLDLKDFKVPKGVTMDYNEAETSQIIEEKTGKPKKQKGTIEIKYLNYIINSNFSNEVFQKK